MHTGHRARVKKEFQENGLAHFPDHKILELLLFYSIPRKDTNEIGHALIKRFGSLSGVFDAPINLLMEVKGIGIESATFIKLISEIIYEYMNDHTKTDNRIVDAETAKEYIRNLFIGETAETIYVVCLAMNGEVLFCRKLAEGSPEKVGIRPVDVVRIALRTNAVKVVISHNHPHGLASPSRTDLMSTEILKSELKRVDIELFDHIIVSNTDIYSMREHSLI